MKGKKTNSIKWLMGIVLCLSLIVTGINPVSSAQSRKSTQIQNQIYVNESHVSISNKSYVIPGILTTPSTATKEHPVPVVLLLHGTGGNKNELGGIYKRLAEKLAKKGYASFRIDFVGSGDSKVPYVKNNFDDSVLDADQSIEFLKKNPILDHNRIGILGWSQGGRIAQVEAARNKSVKALATWASASSNGKTDFESMFLFEQIAHKKGYTDYILPWGIKLKLGEKWFDAMKNSKALDEIKKYTGPLLVIHGSLDIVVAPSKSIALIKAAGSHDITYKILENADHGFLIYKDGVLNPDQSMPEKLLKITTDWFVQKL